MASKLDDETWAKKLDEAAVRGKLNISFLDIPEFTPEHVAAIKARIPNLVELDLRSNALVDLPDELAELRSLKVVRLNYNKLEHLPKVLTRLKRMTRLEMGGCLLREVDETVGSLPGSLRDLDLSGNRIQTVHPAMAELRKLTYLNLENNMLVGLPEEMGEMENLSVLDLSNNQLATLPDTFGGLRGLTRIEVNNNKLTMLPPSMGHLTNLKDFDCRYNELKEPGKSKADGPVAVFLEFLRSEEERLRQEEIERHKPVATQVGAYQEYRMKIEPKAQDEGNGGPMDPTDGRPYLRTGCTLTWGANHLFIFGGALAYGEKQKMNDLFITNLDLMVWRKADPGGDRPSERDGHAAVYDRASKRLLIFGGRNAEKKRLNDLWAYDTVADKWTQLSPDGDKPAPRESASMCLLDDTTAVLFGGKGQGNRLNDLQFLDLTTPHGAWSQPVCGGTVPSPRQDVALCIGDGKKLFLHGGRDNFIREDMYALDFSDQSALTWETIATAGRPPPPCYSHELVCNASGQIFTFGGFDELGGQIAKVYRLDLDPSAGGDSGRLARTSSKGMPPPPEWVEIDAELKFNESRLGVLSPTNCLNVLQVGSESLPSSHNSPEEMFWDVFKIAELMDFSEKELKPEDLVPVNAKKMRVEHTTTSEGKDYEPSIRRRIIHDTPKETKLLRYVNDFDEKFSEFYPRRRKLMLDPPNECGVRKFVCTTVRASKLDYRELYDLDSCVDFVANYLEYEPLENPILFPESIPSPYAVMGWQAGDCFDLAIVLCSLLVGVGYDAYVCLGYAPKYITLNDQSGTMCPVLEREAAERERGGRDEPGGSGAAAAGKTPRAKAKKENKYKVKPPIDLTSKVVLETERLAKEEAAREAVEEMERLNVAEEARTANAAAAEPAEAAGRSDAPSDPAGPEAAAGEGGGDVDAGAEEEARRDRAIDGKRVHAWVVVRAGKREVARTVFVEPTTARQYPVDESPYHGLECIWNNANYYINMRPGTFGGESPGKPLRGVDFEDLNDHARWEKCLDAEEIEIVPASEEDEDEDDETEAAPAEDAPDPNPEARPDGEAEGEAAEPEPAVDPYADHNPDEVVIEMPPSWVPKLKISQEDFDTKCPRGHKTTRYSKSIEEIFAVFGPCMRWDGMTRRLCVFEDEACQTLAEERQVFARRKDKLRERISYPITQARLERFDPGSAFGVKEMFTDPKERRVIFYPGARQDGLLTRHEEFGRKMTETFAARDDNLVYRAVTYDAEATARLLAKAEEAAEAAYQEEIKSGKRRRKKKKVEPPLPVIAKVSQKFELPDLNVLAAKAKERDPDSAPIDPAHKRVRKRVFVLGANGSIRVDYHYGVGRVTADRRLFHKNGAPPVVTQVDASEPEPTHIELAEAFQAQKDAEKACVAELRDVEKESEDMVKNRTKEEQNIEVVTSYYDVTRNGGDDDEDDDEVPLRLDYLSPFLPPLLAGQIPTEKEAAVTRDACLKALKDRLIERANIIQTRHDVETAALKKRDANYQRDRDHLTSEQEEEYHKACGESAFRINILEQRMRRHEDNALSQYYDLDAKIKADPRMVNLGGAKEQ